MIAGNQRPESFPSWSDCAGRLWLPLALVMVAGCYTEQGSPPPTAKTPTAASADTTPVASVAQATPVSTNATENPGLALYRQHCAGCHGEQGDGKGLAAVFLYPKPRDFRSGSFKLVSTENGVPTPEDLDVVIKRGMPGSSMPPWEHLVPDQRRLLAETVMEFRREGARAIERQLAEESGDELTPEAVEEAIANVVTPGAIIATPELPAPSPETLARGRDLYLTKGCVGCHGKEGRGDGQERMVDVDGTPTRPRDLTQGIYKGNPDVASVYRRTLAGMPGTPMPSLRNVPPEDVGALAQFVLSMSTPEAREAAVPRRATLLAAKVSELPSDAESSAWDSIPASQLRTMMLWHREGEDPWVNVQGAHDGKAMAIRLSWKDETLDQSAVRPDEFEDMAAIELYQGPNEPFLGMGVKGTIIDIWQWRAGVKDSGQARQLSDEYPFDDERYRELLKGQKMPDFITAHAGGNPLAVRDHTAANLAAQGLGSTTFRPPISQHVEATAAWKNGRWHVVLKRPLSLGADEGLPLSAGGTYSLAVALWNGSQRDRASQKRITLWNDLRLE